MPRRSASIRLLTWWIAALGVGLAGCDRVFQVDTISGGGRIDSAIDDATTDTSTDAGGGCLSDDFSSAALDETKWTIQDAAPFATVAQTAGQLVFSLSQASGTNYAIVTTPQPRDMTNDALSIEVITPPDKNTSAELGINIQSDNTHRYEFFITGTSLLMRYSTPTGNFDTFVTYSATQLFLRMRNAGGMMFWETSTDGSSWTARRMAPAVVDLANVYVRMFAGTYQLEPVSPGQPAFDNVLIECLP